MSIRVSRRALKSAFAIAGVMVGAAALTGCSSFGSRSFGDPTVTGATTQSGQPSFNQPMPNSLGAPPMQVADSRFVPPANIGGFGGQQTYAQPTYSQPTYAAAITSGAGTMPTVASQDLPVLSSTSSMGTQQAMHAQQSLAPVAAMPPAAAMGSFPPPVTSSPATNVAAAGGNTYKHTIASGESLYTIARRYDVTTQAIVQANGLSSPDRIVVGQAIIIPGRADLLANRAPVTQVAAVTPAMTTPSMPAPLAAAPAPLGAPAPSTLTATTPPRTTPAPAAPAPTQMAAAPQATPAPVAAASAASFRWPISGRIITDFAASKGTGINIEAPDGAAVKAADAGTVIYVGSGVEGYGNLILIRHANGYVSAYAHLKAMSVAKNDTVQRGQAIGSAGQTGSVSRPQLHFELRKGATPVDPVPLLAG